MRSSWRLGWLLSLSMIVPGSALGQSTIKVVPKQGDPPSRSDKPPPEPEEDESTTKKKERVEKPAPLPMPADPPPAGVVPTEGPEPPRIRPLPWIGLAASGGAIIAGSVLLANAAGTLNDPENFEIIVEDDGDSVDVEVSDRFEDSQKSVIINGLTGTLLLSVGITGTVISLIELID